VSAKRTYPTSDSGLTDTYYTISCVAYTVLWLATHDCNGGLLTPYPTVDSVGASVE